MAQTTLSMRADDSLKKNIDNVCDDFGLTSTAAITVFMKAVVHERRIPFEIKASGREQVNAAALDSFLEMRRHVADAGMQDLSDDEINDLIRSVRNAK